MWVVCQGHAPTALPPGKTRYPLYRRLGGLQGRALRVRKIPPPTGIRSPARPALSESLYRLSYPGPIYIYVCVCVCVHNRKTAVNESIFIRHCKTRGSQTKQNTGWRSQYLWISVNYLGSLRNLAPIRNSSAAPRVALSTPYQSLLRLPFVEHPVAVPSGLQIILTFTVSLRRKVLIDFFSFKQAIGDSL